LLWLLTHIWTNSTAFSFISRKINELRVRFVTF
jgi:hypothetical protein